MKNNPNENFDTSDTTNIIDTSNIPIDTTSNITNTDINGVPTIQDTRQIRWLNQAPAGTFMRSSYINNDRRTKHNINVPINDQDNYKSEFIGTADTTSTNNFSAGNIQQQRFAPWKSQRNNKAFTQQELMNGSSLLPSEINDNWFETAPSPIQVNNKHIINTVRPIGFMTNSGPTRGSALDVRGTINVPKFRISPWLNSSIEPDIPRAGLC